jgi:hypothetical protein
LEVVDATAPSFSGRSSSRSHRGPTARAELERVGRNPGTDHVSACGYGRLSFMVVRREAAWKMVHGHNTVVNADAQPYDPPTAGHWSPPSAT